MTARTGLKKRILKRKSGRSARTFKTFEEITKLGGYSASNLVDQSSYRELLGDYELSPKILCCRKKDNGLPCNKEHNFGYVTRLQDGTVSVVGHCCVENHFLAEDRLVTDIRKLESERLRVRALAQVAHILRDKDQLTDKAEGVLRQIDALEKPVIELLESIGPLAAAKLRSMAKRFDREMVLLFEKDVVVEEEDEYGETVTRRDIEKTRLPITVVSPELFDGYQFESLRAIAQRVLNALDEAANVTETLSTFKLEGLNNRTRVDCTEKLNRLSRLSSSFWNWNLDLLIFMNGNLEDRIKTATYLLKRNGKAFDGKSAANWIRNVDEKLKADRGADRLKMI